MLNETHKIVIQNNWPFLGIEKKDHYSKVMDYEITNLGTDGKFLHPITLKYFNVNGNYLQPNTLMDFPFQYQGNSSIKSRNGYRWTALYNKESGIYDEVEMEVYERTYENQNEEILIRTEKYYVIKDEVVECYINFVKKHLEEDMENQAQRWLEKNFKEKKYIEISEFNKLSWYKAIDKLDGKYFWILNEYHTTCGNISVILYNTVDGNGDLYLPDRLKGLVIGKGGFNIKQISRKYDIDFKIK